MESLIMIRLLIRDSKVIVKTNVIGMKPQDMTSSAGRLVWLDWMKALAILSIVWGHFFSEGHLYLYVFSVQVFCVISGFLYKKSPDWRTCLTKCFWQLFVPTVIMSCIMQLEAYFRCNRWNGRNTDAVYCLAMVEQIALSFDGAHNL